VKQNQDFFLYFKICALHKDLIVKFSDTWGIELRNLANDSGNFWPIAFPKQAKNFTENPATTVDNKFRIYLIGAVFGRDMDSPALASKFVYGPEHHGYVNSVVPRLHGVRDLIVFDVFQTVVE